VLYKGTVIIGMAHVEITETKSQVIHSIAFDTKHNDPSYYQFIQNRLKNWLEKNYNLFNKNSDKMKKTLSY
jgi:hypothetical protein